MDNNVFTVGRPLSQPPLMFINAIVIFSVGSRLAGSIPSEENFILAKNLPLDGTKPGPLLLSME
jgi:hypothetical protein